MIGLGLNRSNLAKTVTYDDDSIAFFNQLSTPPNTSRKILYNRFIEDLKELNEDGTTTNFGEHDRLYLRAATDEDSALTSIVNPTSTKTQNINSATFETDRGYTGGGTKYLRWNYTPGTDNVQYLINDSCYWFYSRTNVAENSSDLGVLATNIANLFPKYSDNKAYYYLNNTADSSVTMTDSYNLIAVRRTASNVLELWQNGVLLQTSAAASTALVQVNFVSLARSNNGSIIDPSSRQHAAEGIGSSSIDLRRLQYSLEYIYLDGVGADVPRNVNTIIQYIGQSNFSEFQPKGALPTAYTGSTSNYYTFIKSSDTSGDNGSIANFNVGVNSWVGASGGQYFCPSASMMYKLFNTYGIVGILSNSAIGNTSLSYLVSSASTPWDVDYGGTGNNSYRTIQYYIRKAREKSNPLNKLVLCIELGENDSSDETAANAFYTKMVALIAKYRSSIPNGGTGYTNLPVVIVKIKSDLAPGTHPYVSTIRSAVDSLSANLSNIHIVDATPCAFDTDQIHYSPQGMIDLGNLIADKIAGITTY